MGIEACVTISCGICGESNEIEHEKTFNYGKQYNGTTRFTENCSWYASNFKLVLGTLATGLGPSDIPSLFSFVGLPKLTSFCKRQYTRLESLIGKHLRETANESMRSALEEEIMQTQIEKNLKQERSSDNPIGLTTSQDMGWTKRSSGNRFDSLSGHAFLIGCRLKKILLAQVLSKRCSACSAAEARGEGEAEAHECPRNYEGSSKAMEADAALALITKLDEDTKSSVYVEALVTDDDASTRAILTHPTVRGKGKLPAHIPQPRFLADPSHRTKVVAKAIFVLAHLPKSQSKCSNVDALRIKKYYGYMIKQARNLTIDELRQRCKAVIEHLFNDHTYCDLSWCKPKQVELEVNKIIGNLPSANPPPLAQAVSPREDCHPPSPTSPGPTDNRQSTRKPPSYYHSKTDDKELYEQLIAAYDRFTTPERLSECLHPYDTQVNEALHHVVAKYAPKTRNYSSTMSLNNRISIAIGVHNMGHFNFWCSVFEKMNLAISSDLSSALQNLDRCKEWKRDYQKRKDVKINRVRKQYEKINDLMKKQKKESVRGATYGSGIALQSMVPSEVAKLETQKKKDENVQCVWFGCYAKNHKTNKSKNCRYNTCSSKEDIEREIDLAMRTSYPSFYGER